MIFSIHPTKALQMKRFLKDNSLSLVFVLLFMITLVGQAVTGLKEHNKEMMDEGL